MDEKLIGPPEPCDVQKNDTWKKDRKNFKQVPPRSCAVEFQNFNQKKFFHLFRIWDVWNNGQVFNLKPHH